MNITPFRASLEEVQRERARAVEELNAAKAAAQTAEARAGAAEAKIARLDRIGSDLSAILKEAQADAVTPSLPLGRGASPVPAGAEGLAALAFVGVAAGTAIHDNIVAHQKRNRDRTNQILQVMATGPRDWELTALVDEMAVRGFTNGLTQPFDAIRVALDRIAKKDQSVIKVGPGKYRLRSRMTEQMAAKAAAVTAVTASKGVVL
jgi:hypothetical protein